MRSYHSKMLTFFKSSCLHVWEVKLRFESRFRSRHRRNMKHFIMLTEKYFNSNTRRLLNFVSFPSSVWISFTPPVENSLENCQEQNWDSPRIVRDAKKTGKERHKIFNNLQHFPKFSYSPQRNFACVISILIHSDDFYFVVVLGEKTNEPRRTE